jgi:OOP family OmpA-OmpF porin
MRTIKRGMILLISMMFAQNLFAQIENTIEPEYKSFNRFYIGLNGGTMVTFTNIKQQDYMPVSGEWKFGGGAIVGYQVSPILGLQGQFIYGDLAGEKTNWRNNVVANLKFSSNLMEYGVNATVSLSKWWAPRLKLNEKLDFYGMLGFGFISFRAQLTTLDQGVFVAARGYDSNGNKQGSRTLETVFPIGLGVKYRITEKIFINLETNLRNLNSDKLDAFERQYNPRDKYSYTHFGINYIFGKKEKSLQWVNMVEYEKAKNGIDGNNALALRVDSLAKEVAALKNNRIDSITKAIVKPVDDKVTLLDRKTTDISNKVDSLMSDKQVSFGAVLPSVYFETGSYKISNLNFTNLAAVALYLRSNPNARLTIIAHTDKRDIKKYNLNNKLANNRAKAVLNMLAKEYNIDKSRLDIDIRVSKDPLSNKNDAINRRVDFLINK